MVEGIAKVMLIFVAVFALQFLHDRLYRPARIDSMGWRWLRPGFIHYFAFFGSAAFATLMWWVYLFVGSARADAATQETAMLLIAVAMTCGAALVWFTCFLRRYAWAESTFKVMLFNWETRYDLGRLSEIDLIHNGQTVVLRFTDGRRVSFSADMHGADDLADHIDQMIF
jgi:hypothetical protein